MDGDFRAFFKFYGGTIAMKSTMFGGVSDESEHDVNTAPEKGTW